MVKIWKAFFALVLISLAGFIPASLLYANGLIGKETLLILSLLLSFAVFVSFKIWADRQFKKDQERICREWQEMKSE